MAFVDEESQEVMLLGRDVPGSYGLLDDLFAGAALLEQFSTSVFRFKHVAGVFCFVAKQTARYLPWQHRCGKKMVPAV